MLQYLKWRKENDIDRIRNDIINGGCNHPSRFPNGQKILKLIPQIVIDHNVRDKWNCPIVFEQYNFCPAEVLSQVTLEEYVEYVKYCLEYRTLILEQLSEEQETEKFQALCRRKMAGDDLSDAEPYGTICHLCIIRDLGGVGFEHVGSQGQDIMKAVIGRSLTFSLFS